MVNLKIPIWAFVVFAFLMLWIGFFAGRTSELNHSAKDMAFASSVHMNELIELLSQLPGLSYEEHVMTLDNPPELVHIRYSTAFIDKSHAFGGIKNVPWDKWTIQEKMYLCAYGSSGNKMSKEDIQEIREKYEE